MKVRGFAQHSDLTGPRSMDPLLRPIIPRDAPLGESPRTPTNPRKEGKPWRKKISANDQ